MYTRTLSFLFSSNHSIPFIDLPIIPFAHYLRLLLLFATARRMLIPRPVRSPSDSPIDDRIITDGAATIILVLGIIVFLSLTYAIQKFMARMGDNNNDK